MSTQSDILLSEIQNRIRNGNFSYSDSDSFRSIMAIESYVLASASAVNFLLKALTIDSLAKNTLTEDELNKVKIVQMISDYMLSKAIEAQETNAS
jgi:hypothetical protein